jgi:NADPH:quinone reductase-like Zn-dependent oxidoreductase
MKAIGYYEYGTADVLRLVEVNKPVPKSDEVLVKIKFTTVNRTDTGFRMAEYFVSRLFSGLLKPKQAILGSEFSGEIENIGEKVKDYKIGDRVFGLSTYKFGTHAEYICMKENSSMTKIPENYSFEEAACVLDGLMLAQNYIRKIDFSKNPNILINGATGSIGTACLQLAKINGAKVTAVGNTKNLPLLKELGADRVIDYTQTDFTNDAEKYDFVIDTVGKSTFFKCKKILNPKGVYFSTELGPYSQNIYLPLLTFFSSGKKIKFPIPTDNRALIEYFASIISTGKYKAIIDSEYPLEKTAEAHRYVERGEKTGNVLIRIS